MDLISSLPDPILCHILSFLPTKSSFATSVLARRWKFLWTSTRNLLFEDDYDEGRTGFSDMVDRVMLLHNGPIDSLSILPYECTLITQHQIDAWISTAIARKVQVLSLSCLTNVLPPQCCFNCKTLVELTLEYCTISAKPGTVCLPKLEKLSLLSSYYEDDESLPNFLSGCLAVESLVLEIDSDGCEMVCVRVCSPTVKSLELKFSLSCYESNHNHKHKLMLDFPSVQYLRVDYDSYHTICAENLSSLVVADILYSYELLDEDEENIGQWRDAFQFLEKLSNAKSLTFRSSVYVEPLNLLTFATTAFHNLTQLKLEADRHFLTELLGSAYNLESLTIEKVEDDLKSWREPKHVPECLLSSLKYVYIFGFYGRDNEFDMVRYILRHAIVLEAIKIYFEFFGYDSERDMRRRIRRFPRGSQNCMLTFATEIPNLVLDGSHGRLCRKEDHI